MQGAEGAAWAPAVHHVELATPKPLLPPVKDANAPNVVRRAAGGRVHVCDRATHHMRPAGDAVLPRVCPGEEVHAPEGGVVSIEPVISWATECECRDCSVLVGDGQAGVRCEAEGIEC